MHIKRLRPGQPRKVGRGRSLLKGDGRRVEPFVLQTDSGGSICVGRRRRETARDKGDKATEMFDVKTFSLVNDISGHNAVSDPPFSATYLK